MGRKHIWARKYLYLCLTSLIFFSFFGCATVEGMKKRRVAHQGLLRGQELLAGGAYEESLRENQEVYSMVGESAPGDEALFTMGLIYAHYENPAKDYCKAISFFNKLIEDYPRSALTEQARIWVGTLDAIEREKLDALEKKRQAASETVPEEREVKGQEQSADRHLIRSQQLLAEGDYQGALRENQQVLARGDKKASGDKALFNAGLIYAHYENPAKDYNEAIRLFNQLIKVYPRSTLVEQAKLWVGTLEIIEKAKQVDIEIEKKKKELENQVMQPEDVPSGSESTTTVPEQPITPANAKEVKQDKKTDLKKREPIYAVLKEGGGNLSLLAEKYYERSDATFCDLILKNNPAIIDVRKIDDNQKITIPVIVPVSYVEESSDGGYRIHVATFYTPESANAYVKGVKNLTKPLSVEAYHPSSKDTWYRVTMDDFKDREEALRMVNLLEEKGLIYIPPEFAVMKKEKQVDSEKAEKKGELKQQE